MHCRQCEIRNCTKRKDTGVNAFPVILTISPWPWQEGYSPAVPYRREFGHEKGFETKRPDDVMRMCKYEVIHGLATAHAADEVIERWKKNKLENRFVRVSRDSNFGDVMVVGGGISGIQASLDLATAGFKVYLVEKGPSIGGHMAQLGQDLSHQ